MYDNILFQLIDFWDNNLPSHRLRSSTFTAKYICKPVQTGFFVDLVTLKSHYNTNNRRPLW